MTLEYEHIPTKAELETKIDETAAKAAVQTLKKLRREVEGMKVKTHCGECGEALPIPNTGKGTEHNAAIDHVLALIDRKLTHLK